MSNTFLMTDKKYFGMGLKAIDLYIIAQVSEFNRNGLECYMTTKKFVEQFGESEKTIRRSIDKLVELNVLTKRVVKTDRKGNYGKERVLNVVDISQWKFDGKRLKRKPLDNNDESTSGHIDQTLPPTSGHIDQTLPPTSGHIDQSTPVTETNKKKRVKENLLKEKGADALDCEDNYVNAIDKTNHKKQRFISNASSEELNIIYGCYSEGVRYREISDRIKESYGMDIYVDRQFLENIKKELMRRDSNKSKDKIMSYLRDNSFLINILCGKIHCDNNDLAAVVDSVISGKPNLTYNELTWFIDNYIVDDGLDMESYNKNCNLNKGYKDYYDFISMLSRSRETWICSSDAVA